MEFNSRHLTLNNNAMPSPQTPPLRIKAYCGDLDCLEAYRDFYFVSFFLRDTSILLLLSYLLLTIKTVLLFRIFFRILDLALNNCINLDELPHLL